MVNLLPWQAITASIFVLLGLFFIVLSSPSFAKTPLNEGQQIIRYDVYAAGVHALQSDLTLDLQGKERYSATLKAKTYGLLGKLAPWEGTFESHGWQAALYKPELHQSSSTWRGEKEIKKYSYSKDGSFESFTIQDHGKKESVRKVDDKLTQGTSDVLTATLNTMRHITKTGKCDGETDVFDGKRRFKLIFVQTDEVELEASRWNVYSGPAVECTAEVKPIAGKWHEKPRGWMSIQEQGRKHGTIPTIWFAKIKENEPAVPVKVRVKTSHGTLFMHMTKYEAAGKSLQNKK